MKEHIWNYVVNKKVLNRMCFVFYSLDSSVFLFALHSLCDTLQVIYRTCFALMTAFHTLAVLSISFMRSSPGMVCN